MARWSLSIAGAALAVIAVAAALFSWRGLTHRYPGFNPQDAANWHSFGGDWILQDGIYTDHSDGRGDKLLGGPSDRGDYAVAADVRFDTAPQDPSFGDAGLLLRVLDPAIGVDALRGYYAALRPDDHMLLIGTMSFGFRELATTPFPHELRTGRWYHLTFTSRGCTFVLRAEDLVSGENAELSYVEQTCDPSAGQVGVRSYYAKSSWRNLQVRTMR